VSAVRWSVEIERGDRWGPFSYWLTIRPAPRFGTTMRTAWTRTGAEAKARRMIARAEAMGPKTPQDRFVVGEVTQQ
jgi:hypothetical protein